VLTAIDPKTGAGALAPLVIGSILMVMVFAAGPISGGHLNPGQPGSQDPRKTDHR
jgi:glycerol uptake facilitator-like aquaporin